MDKNGFDDLSLQDEKEIVKELQHKIRTELFEENKSGIYAYTQIHMGFHSNKIEGGSLTEDQTSVLFHTGTLRSNGEDIIRAKDIEEMVGHFSMFDEMIKTIDLPLSEDIIKKYHYCLKSDVFEDKANGYPVGEYKNRKNMVSDISVVSPEDVPGQMKELLFSYHPANESHSLLDLAWFHARYEAIHPFQDGNGRTGRMILFRESLKNGLIPVIITDNTKSEYYHHLRTAQTGGGLTGLTDYFKNRQLEYYSMVQDYLYIEKTKPSDIVSDMIQDAKNEILAEESQEKMTVPMEKMI